MKSSFSKIFLSFDGKISFTRSSCLGGAFRAFSTSPHLGNDEFFQPRNVPESLHDPTDDIPVLVPALLHHLSCQKLPQPKLNALNLKRRRDQAMKSLRRLRIALSRAHA